MPDDIFQKHDALRTLPFWQGQEAVQVTRNVDDGQFLLLRFKGQPHCEVPISVDELGHFDLASEHDRHQFRTDRSSKIRGHKLRIGLVKFVLAHEADVFTLQCRDHFVKRLVILFAQALNARDHLSKGLVVGKSEGGLGVFVHHQDPLQVGHPHAIKLVQVVGENTQKPNPLNQRRACNLRLLQHALVE